MIYLRAMMRQVRPLYLLAVLAIGYTFILTGQGQSWLREGAWAVDWLGLSPAITGSIVAGYTFAVTSLAFRQGRLNAYGVSRRGVTGHLTAIIVGATTISLVAQLLALGALWIMLSAHGVNLPAPKTTWLILLPSIAAGPAYAAIGARLGSIVRLPALAPVLSLVMFGLFDIVGLTRAANLIVFGGATSSLIGIQHRADVEFAQAAWCALLAVAVILGRKTIAGITSIAIACAAGVFVISLGPNRFHAVVETPTCSGAQPIVCVFPDYRSQLAQTRKLAIEIDNRVALIDGGVKPRVWTQTSNPNHQLPSDTVHLRLDGRSPSPIDMSASVVEWISECPEPTDPSEARAASTTAQLITLSLAAPSSTAANDELETIAPAWFKLETTAQRLHWLTSTAVPAWRTCSFSSLTRDLD